MAVLKTSFLFLILGTVWQCTDALLSEFECTTMRCNVAQLGTSLRRACKDGPNPAEWEPLPLTKLGFVNMKTNVIQTFKMPPSVPATATEVFIYLYIGVCCLPFLVSRR